MWYAVNIHTSGSFLPVVVEGVPIFFEQREDCRETRKLERGNMRFSLHTSSSSKEIRKTGDGHIRPLQQNSSALKISKR